MKKYSSYYKILIISLPMSIVIIIGAVIEKLPELIAMFSAIGFVLLMGILACPDKDKYTYEYNQRRQGRW